MAPLPKPLLYGTTFATMYGISFLVKDYTGGKKYEGDEKLTDKVVIVTGANTGIGKEVARELAKREAKVIMACRDMQKCETTRQEIVLDTKNKYVYCKECDLASQESIRNFVNSFKKDHSQLHVLVNNAGVMRTPYTFTKDGIEMQIGVNHMGHFLLTNLLLDTLKASAPSRIVNVSSLAHRRGVIKVHDLNSAEYYDAGEAYAQSKLANVIFTKSLAKMLKGTEVTVNAVHPGIVDTDLTRHMTYYNSYMSYLFIKPVVWPFIRTPRQGAQPVVYAAISSELNGKSGEYIDSDYKIALPHPTADREDLQAWLWKTSARWTKLETGS